LTPATFFIGEIEADDFITTGMMDIATGRLMSLHANGNLQADLNVDGPVDSMIVDGYYLGNVNIQGTNGSLGYLSVGRDLIGSLNTGNYIGTIEVRNGDLVADVQAGGSNALNQAIGMINVRRGDLVGDVSTVPNAATVRPGGGIGAVIVRGTVYGDIHTYGYYDATRGNLVTAGIDEIYVRDGSLNGDVTIQPNNLLNPMDPGGDLFELYVRNGSVNGDVTVYKGDIGELTVKGGSLNGDVDVFEGDLGRLIVYANGSPAVDGAIYVDGDLDYVKVKGGMFNASLTVEDVLGTLWTDGLLNQAVDAGYIGTMAIRAGSSAGGTITSANGLGSLESRADVSGDVTVTGNVGTMKIRGGDLDAEFSVDGNVGTFQIKGGRVSTNSDPSDERIEITGDVASIRIYKYGGGGAIIDDDIYVGDELSYFRVEDGDFAGTLTAGSIGTAIYDTPNGVTNGIVSNANLDVLKVYDGPIDSDITVMHHVGLIDARRGVTDTALLTIGSGFPGAGLDELKVRGGNMEGHLDITGNLGEVTVRGNVDGSQIDVSGAFSSLNVRGDLLNADINVGGAFYSAYVRGNYTDTNIDANTLGQVKVKRMMSSTAPPHEIHANTGSFELSVGGFDALIDDLAGVWVNGVHAYVG